MPVSQIDVRNFVRLRGGGKGNFNHRVDRGNFYKSERVWFRKEMAYEATARREVLAQEFLRLIIPRQPVTRLGINPKHNTFFVLSEEVLGFKALPTGQHDKFLQGTITGIGEVLLCAAYVHDVDPKNGNVGLNSNNEVIKIDGDWCFAHIASPADYLYRNRALTTQLIQALPYPHHYYAYHWLDVRVEGVSRLYSRIINTRFSTNDVIRGEINHAILRLLLVPDNFLEQLVINVLSSPLLQEQHLSFLQLRREELKHSAMADSSFISFLDTEDAINAADNFYQELIDFNLSSELNIASLVAQESNLDLSFDNLFEGLFGAIKPTIQRTPTKPLEIESLWKSLVKSQTKATSVKESRKENVSRARPTTHYQTSSSSYGAFWQDKKTDKKTGRDKIAHQLFY